MSWLLIATLLFTTFIVALELRLGFAIVGWTGDNMVVERAKSPGPYWFGITLHVIVGFGIPLLVWFAF